MNENKKLILIYGTCDKHFEDSKINVNYITLDVMVFIKCMDVETVSAYTMYFSSYKIVFYNYMYNVYTCKWVSKQEFCTKYKLIWEINCMYILHVPLVLFIL